ncbi:MAG: TetR/AcrR family transcriptional regulator [Polyangiaceae bacterium]
MARVTKRPEQRRAELLDIAQRLVFEHGYEATTIAAILDAARLSKGAFYHHFASKEELLDGLASRFVDRGLDALGGILASREGGSVARLRRFLSATRRLDAEQAPLVVASVTVMHRPANLALRQRIHELTLARMAPPLAEVVEAGLVAGELRVGDPLGTAEVILQLGAASHQAIALWLAATPRSDPSDLQRRLHVYEVAVNRLLGLADDTLRYLSPGFAEALASAASSGEGPAWTRVAQRP